MARKLKTYQHSLGFFDLALAAPSMKAALEAWGADSNLFHQGAAKESHDPDVIAATLAKAGAAAAADGELFHQGAAKESHDPDVIAVTMAKPGVVLRRPVGTDRPFSEH